MTGLNQPVVVGVLRPKGLKTQWRINHGCANTSSRIKPA
jgi:hypothetical protein